MSRSTERRLGLWHAAIAVGAGILIASHAGPWNARPWSWAALTIAALWFRRAHMLVGLFVWVGIGATASAWHVRHDALATAQIVGIDDRFPDDVVGTVRGPVTRLGATSDDARWGATIEAARADVWMWSPIAIRPGDRVHAKGRLRSSVRYQNPGAVDHSVVVRQRGAPLEMSASQVSVDGAGSEWPWRWADGVRTSWSTAVAAIDSSSSGAAIVRGAVVGDRSAISEDTNQRWRAVGVFHVLSVSGLHLAIVALALFAGLRRGIAATRLALWASPAALAALPSLLAAFSYTVITGAEVATVRALIAVAFVIVGEALARPRSVLDALGGAAVVILLMTPSAVADPSFQLSFTAAIVFVVLPKVRHHARSRLRRGVGNVIHALLASLAVTWATTPITALAFQQLAWGGLLGNLIVTPICELAMIPIALIGLLLSSLWSPLGAPLLRVAVWLTSVVDRIVAAQAPLTPVVMLRPPTIIETMLWLLGGVALLLGWRRTLRWRIALPLAVAALSILAWLRLRAPLQRGDDGILMITYLDVGQGDAAVIEVPGGEVWLVDAGGAPDAGSLEASIAPGEAVVRFLRARGIEHIDVAIVSHPHPDHYLGLLAISRAMQIDQLWAAEEIEAPPVRNAKPHGEAPAWPGFQSVAAQLAQQGTRVLAPPLGIARQRGDASIRIEQPSFQGTVATADPVRSVNDNSLVVAIEYRGHRALFLGDVEAEGEAEVISHGHAAATIVKVAHHGSRTSSTDELIAATRASYAVVSSGRGNRFGLPRAEVLQRWRDAGAVVLRIDAVGAVTAKISPNGEFSVATYVAASP